MNTGPTLGFVGLAFMDRVNVQVLEQPIRLDYHHTDAKLRVTTARYLGAMRNAMDKLKQYYDLDVPDVATRGTEIQLDPRLPCYSHYTCLADSIERRLTYLSQPARDKLIFFGEADKMEVCVKFVTRYSKEAHLYCASRGIAPTLRGFEALPGGWFMVVMDCIDNLFTPSHTARPGLATELRGLILEEMERLHQAGFVHGDLRDTNLMVRKDGQPGFMLVDFDWAGQIGETRYPMNVYKGADLWRPDDAYDGEIIRADHDNDMVRKMLEDLGI